MNFKTIEYTENKLIWIDQTCLPGELTYKTSSDYNHIIEAIKRLEIRGAPAIGVAAGYGIAIAAIQNDNSSPDFIENIGAEFKASRPTAVNLFWAVDRMLTCFKNNSDLSHNDLLSTLSNEALAIHNEDIEMCQKIGEHGATLINDGDVILTHCNAGALATGGIGTALGVIYTANKQGKKISVYADETRPLLQGARLTAWELKQEGIDVTLITDNTAGMLMRQGRIDHIIVGADRVTKNGDVANKIGTYSVAVLAKENNIPFYVALPESTFDFDLNHGDDIIIEERAAEEVTEGFGKRTAPENVAVYSPAFDVTPAEFISYYITNKGLKKGARG